MAKKCGTPFVTCRIIAQSGFLLQLALSLLGEVKMFLDHLGRVVREFLHVGITAVLCLVLKADA